MLATLQPLRAVAGLLGLSLATTSIHVLAADPTDSGNNPFVKDPTNNLSYKGTITTTDTTTIEHYLNIRFASAARFSAPTRFLPSSGSLIDATTPGPACPQSLPAIPPFFSETHAISEDCLNLRISRPSGVKADAKLPVVVHIHGGGVVKGSAYDPHFDPDRLLALSVELGEPIIYVAINYRLTIFGFPRLPILKKQKSLNLGMRDQRVALEWVRDNIGHFGGDPERVTAFGLSAGGTFTSLQMVAYAGEQGAPFTRAWMMSGPPGTALNMTEEKETERHTRNVAERVGCISKKPEDEDGEDEDEKLLSCLRSVPMEELTEKAMGYSVENHPPAGLFTFIPSVDGDFIPERQSVLYQSGRFVKGIPTILSWAQDDGATNAGPAPLFVSESSMIHALHSFVGPSTLSSSDISTLFSLYPESDFLPEYLSYLSRKSDTDPEATVHYFRISRILRDILFTCSSIDFGYHLSRASYAETPDFAGVRLYTLNQSMLTPLFKGAGMPYLGAVHGSDTYYIFNGVFPELGDACSEEDQKLARQMAGAFVRFAASGDPSPTDQKKGEGDEGWVWPEAFGGPELEAKRGLESLQGVNVHVIGGPVGTGSCKVRHHGIVADAEDLGSMQKPIVGEGVEYGEMGGKDEDEESTAAKKPEQVRRKREALLEREKLLKRCAFINTLNEKLGV
ncbi:Alpha/Beta hydrolase protein [Pseudoneurospora amorphoporcata]|uniref:Alpha/Beta hydrolase protein n=1 Tax=Pseudoneurospora amorphoporcata TaxID=241081 RepID=A0AAN6NM97_9PEZI|nr:Alpha/Beta hydrolase protein [Pseudoneurospora amorphoporcata]